jgi:hypothetical protein
MCCLVLAACDAGWTLKEFTGRSLVFLVTDPKLPAFQVVLDYDITAKGCGSIGGTRATQESAELKLSGRGGAADATDACPRPYWNLAQGDAAAPYTTVKLTDSSLTAQAVMQNLFASRSVLLKSTATGRVGDLVQFDFQPVTDSMEALEVSFLADGATEIDKVIWYNAVSGQAQWEKNTVKVAIPARQSAAVGRVRFVAQPKAAAFACDNLASCKTDGLEVSGQFPFTVTP